MTEAATPPTAHSQPPAYLVPLDGSALAERALPYATALARATGGRLLLLAMHTTNVGVSHQDLEDCLGALALRAADEGVPAVTQVHDLDFVEDAVPLAIVDVAREEGVDAIVIATHARGGLTRALLGSVADEVLRRAPVPTILVPAACRRGWPTDRRPRLLVPLDGSPLAAEALPHAAELATRLGAEVLLLRVSEPLSYRVDGESMLYLSRHFGVDLVDTRQSLEAAAASLAARAPGLPVATHAVVGQVNAAIADVARDWPADLVVMATHGRGGAARFFMGSIALGVVQRCDVPVYLVRPSAVRVASSQRPAVTTAAGAGTTEQPRRLEVSLEELVYLERGLGALIYSTGLDPQSAGCARDLLRRLRAEEREAASETTAVAAPPA